MDNKDKQILKDTLAAIPQVQAWKIIRAATSPEDMACQVLLASGMTSLNDEQRKAIIGFMTLGKQGRELLAGEIIGKLIEQKAPGVLSKIFGFLFGWLK